MLVLGLDTSSPAVSAAVVEVDERDPDRRPRTLAEHRVIDARGHGENLAPLIDRCLRAVTIGPGELAAVVAGTGPGPYTGLRVGLVTAAVLADVLAIPAYGVCSLDAIAAGVRPRLVLTDARRKEVYWARYNRDGARVDGPHVSRPADVAITGHADLAGAGARLYQDLFAGATLHDGDFPVPADLVARAADRICSGAPSEQLTPRYLRRPDAIASATRKTVTP